MGFSFASISLSLKHPALLLMIVPILGIILSSLFWRSRKRTIQYGGLEYLINAGVVPAARKRRSRMLLMSFLALVLGLAWSSPEIRTARPLSFGPSQRLRPAFLIAMDVSGSMTDPLGGYIINGELNSNGITRFEGARKELYSFVERYHDADFGLVLFSANPILVRWPTISDYNLRDILDEGMRYTNPDRERPSQLARFAGGTSTLAGLALAGSVLEKQEASRKSLILIADLIDNTDKIIKGINSIKQDDIDIYVLAIDPEEKGLSDFLNAFKNSSNVRVFTAKSTAEIGKAFTKVARLEQERQIKTGNQHYAQDLRWLAALIGFVIALGMLVLFGTKLHKTEK